MPADLADLARKINARIHTEGRFMEIDVDHLKHILECCGDLTVSMIQEAAKDVEDARALAKEYEAKIGAEAFAHSATKNELQLCTEDLEAAQKRVVVLQQQVSDLKAAAGSAPSAEDASAKDARIAVLEAEVNEAKQAIVDLPGLRKDLDAARALINEMNAGNAPHPTDSAAEAAVTDTPAAGG